RGGRADKRAGFDRDTGALRDLNDRDNVVLMGARGAVWSNLQFVVRDLAGQSFNSGGVCATGSRQSDISRVDAECFHQVKQLEFLFDWRLRDRRRLQTITQRFVVDPDVPVGSNERWFNRIPIVN